MPKYANEFSLYVVGQPKPQARPRFFRVGAGVRAHSPKTLFFNMVYGEAVRKAPKVPLDGPLSLRVYFFMPRPQNATSGKNSSRTWHISRPDLDNMEKAVMDAFTQAGVWRDDSLVCEKMTSKVLTPLHGEQRPGVFIWVAQIKEPYVDQLAASKDVENRLREKAECGNSSL